MSEHTKYQWWADVEDPSPLIRIYSGTGFSRRMIADGMHPKDARRIVACVNACAGLSTEALEQLPLSVGFTLNVGALTQQRDQLLAALCLALPFVEDHEGDNGYKPGSVAKAVKTIREAVAAAEQQCKPAA